jgi:hypothetical protein
MGDVRIGLAVSVTLERPRLAIRSASVVFPSARKPTGHARFQSAPTVSGFVNKLTRTLARCPPTYRLRCE